MSAKTEATGEELLGVPDNAKAELVDGVVVPMSPAGGLPGYAADEIYASLREYARRTGSGLAVGDNRAFVVNLPNRKSFSPDTAYYMGPRPTMQFFDGAPAFAVEVRSEHDYGRQAGREIARKRADYFAAGTLVVWDVDLLGEDVVRVYRVGAPDTPTIYRRGDMAEAEPAVPGWSMAVDDLFL